MSNNNTEFNNVVESTDSKVFCKRDRVLLPRIGSTSPDVDIKAYYQMNNQKVSPFALERVMEKEKLF